MLRFVRFFLFATFLLLNAGAFALTPDAKYSTVRILGPMPDPEDPARLIVGIDIALQKDWKTYWRLPGDAGLAPRFDWSGSANILTTETLWPAPERFILEDLDNFGYHDGVIFPIRVARQDPALAAALNLKLDILVCHDICVPETHVLKKEIPAVTLADVPDAPLLVDALAKVPAPMPQNMLFSSARLIVDSQNRVFIEATAPQGLNPGKNADLFIENEQGLVFGKPAVRREEAGWIFKAPVHSTEPFDKLASSLGAAPLTLTYTDRDVSAGGYQQSIDLAATGTTASGVSFVNRLQSLSIGILFTAFLGGLILNLMPCVLPVLSLKILSVISHGGKDDKKSIRRNFLASAAGVIFSFWIMAAVLIALKNAGQTIGWGIQFQSPAFIIFMAGILFLFALNLWGAFEIPLPRFIANRLGGGQMEEPTLTGHFLTGAFATLLATPCTAPILGTAVGFALASGGLEISLIFTFLGLGLSFPYILLAFSPGLFRRMPKPGAWMVKIKKILAVAMLATGLWLASLLISVSQSDALSPGWQVFNEALIAPAVDSGQTVFVDVTARWCLTCKANKKFILESKTVQDALAADNILLLQADWTERDENIAAYLKKYGRYGIPFNIVYGPGAPEGIALPELLSETVVLNALATASGE
jgi:suppressor for copper-sensitivity B